MVKKVLVLALLVWLGGIFFITTAYADIAFDYGAAFRLRQEIWDNVMDLKTMESRNPDRNFFRLRTSVWGKADLDKDLGAYLKLTNEAKYYTGPYKLLTERLEENEVVFDNLYLKANNVFKLPVDLKIGRQDFLGPDMFGEGFLILDGTPGDGSRTFYFNAAKAKWRINQNNSIDFVYISNQQRDKYMPSLHSSIKNTSTYYNHKVILNTSDEQGFVVYGRNKISESLSVEPYYMYKTEKEYRANPELELNTIGARALFSLADWKFRGEYAHQFGEYDGGRDRSGNGGYIFVSRKLADVQLKPEFEFGFVYLSGDDPDSSKNEGWNPLFSRNPSWNELLIYTLVYENLRDSATPGYWTNLQLYMAKVNMDLSPDTKLSLSWQLLRACERANPLSSFRSMFGNGKERGHLPTVMLGHKFSKKIDGFLQLEYFVPGDFYADDAKNATFFRWQLQFKI